MIIMSFVKSLLMYAQIEEIKVLFCLDQSWTRADSSETIPQGF